MEAILAAHPLAVKVGMWGILAIALIGYGVKRYFKYINSDSEGNDWM